MTQQILKAIYKHAIKEDKELQCKIAMASKGKNGNTVAFRTIERWLKEDSEKLTTATTLKVIREHMSLSADENLTEPVTADMQT